MAASARLAPRLMRLMVSMVSMVLMVLSVAPWTHAAATDAEPSAELLLYLAEFDSKDPDPILLDRSIEANAPKQTPSNQKQNPSSKPPPNKTKPTNPSSTKTTTSPPQ